MITTTTLNQNLNLDGISTGQIDSNQMMLDGQIERTHVTDKTPKLKSRQQLKLSTYNVRTLLKPGKLHQVTIGCQSFNIDIVAIQEHRWQTKEETSSFCSNGYHFIYSSASEKSQGGVGILIADKFVKSILYVKSISNRILLVTINCNPKITIICTYAPTEEALSHEKDTFYNTLNDCIRDVPAHNFLVLMGDLNARVGVSDAHLKTVGRYPYHTETNDNGNRLINLCEANDMCIATTRQPHPDRHKWSWQHPNGNKAQLDHIVLRGKWINSLRNCRCYDTVEIDSDHRIVTGAVKFSFRTVKQTSNKPMYNHKILTTNSNVRDNFQLVLTNRFQQLSIDEEDSAQTAYDKLESVLNEAASKILPKREKDSKKPWVSAQSINLIEKRQSARKKYQNHRNPENHDTWRRAAEQADESLANDKIKKIEQMCTEAEAASRRNDSKELFSIVRKLNGTNPTTSPLSVNKRNGNPPSSFNELLDEWAEYFKELLNTNIPCNPDEIHPAEQNLDICTKNFTFEEVYKAVKSIKTGKSPGITIEGT